MKATLAALLSLALVGAAAGDATAAAPKKKHTPYASKYSKHYAGRHNGWRRGESFAGYYEHTLDRVPFGSAQWWSVRQESQSNR